MIISLAEASPDIKQQFLAAVSELWGSSLIVSRGRVWDVARLDGFVSIEDRRRFGALTYRIEGDEMEVVTLQASPRSAGTGSALMAGAIEEARRLRCRRVWLVTTNDNLDALRFYQRRGFRIAAIYVGAMEEARRLKPSIPIVGEFGIEKRDEVEMEMRLD